MATIKVDVVSAEESIFSGDAELVSLPGKSGELGILPGHVPLITLIRPGFVRIHLPGKKEVEQVFVAGGVLEVQPDLVTVLADTAVRSNDLDEAKAAKALEDARAQRQNATGEIEIARLEAEMAALAAQIVALKKIRQQRYANVVSAKKGGIVQIPPFFYVQNQESAGMQVSRLLDAGTIT